MGEKQTTLWEQYYGVKEDVISEAKRENDLQLAKTRMIEKFFNGNAMIADLQTKLETAYRAVGTSAYDINAILSMRADVVNYRKTQEMLKELFRETFGTDMDAALTVLK